MKYANQSTRAEKPPDSTYNIKSIVFPVPTLWIGKPALWFAQLEGQLALLNITFYYVISQLDNKYAAKVEDVITNTSLTDRCDRII
jgi:hypothetical protein